MARTFETDRAGRVLTVRFDNPPYNFMNRTMVAELDDLLGSLEDDRSIAAVVLTGKPEGLFLTHYDVEEILAGSKGIGRPVPAGVAGASLQTVAGLTRIPGAKQALRRTPAAGMIELRRLHDAFARMQRMDKVFIAALNGPALGGRASSPWRATSGIWRRGHAGSASPRYCWASRPAVAAPSAWPQPSEPPGRWSSSWRGGP